MERILSYKKIIIPVLLLVFAIGYYAYAQTQNKGDMLESGDWLMEEEVILTETDVEEEVPVMRMMVDLKGAVENPGVYEAEAGERVIDLVARAGGLTEAAAETQVNFAMYVEDEMVIYIPVEGEDLANEITAQTFASGSSTQGKININKANEAELERLPGVGPAKAQAIMAYREQNGAFKSAEDLMQVTGIGEKTFEKMAEQVTVR